MHALQALADPTRREIVELLATGERNAGEIAAHFDVSRPAVSRHLRVLREHGLVRARQLRQQRIYSLDRAPLEELDAWLQRYRAAARLRSPAAGAHLEQVRSGPVVPDPTPVR